MAEKSTQTVRWPVRTIIGSLHGLWGVLLLVGLPIASVTPVHGVQYIVSKPFAMGLVFIFVALCAFIAKLRGKDDTLGLIFLAPQQFVLTLNACAAAAAIASSQYADGVGRPWSFILADQSTIICLFILHTIVVTNLVRTRW